MSNPVFASAGYQLGNTFIKISQRNIVEYDSQDTGGLQKM
jgi:hypothetical protein